MDPSQKTALSLLALSVVFGAGWGALQTYTEYFLQPIFTPQIGPSALQRVEALALPVLEYLMTPMAFYLLGRRALPGFRTRLGLGVVYAGSFVGMMGGLAPFALVNWGGFYPLPFPFAFITSALQSLELLLPAFSGLALARLSKEGLRLGRTSPALPLAAMAFALPLNFFFGYERLGGPNINFVTLWTVSLGLLAATPVEFLVFYAMGRRLDLRRRAFRAFGLLFLGTYAGAALGTALAVVLFGQSQWAASISGSSYFQNGIYIANLSYPLVTLLDGLNPLSALPFLSFFGLTLSQVGKAADESTEAATGMTASTRRRPGLEAPVPCRRAESEAAPAFKLFRRRSKPRLEISGRPVPAVLRGPAGDAGVPVSQGPRSGTR